MCVNRKRVEMNIEQIVKIAGDTFPIESLSPRMVNKLIVFAKSIIKAYVAEQNPVAEMRWRDGEPLVKFNGFVEAGTKLYALKGETE